MPSFDGRPGSPWWCNRWGSRLPAAELTRYRKAWAAGKPLPAPDWKALLRPPKREGWRAYTGEGSQRKRPASIQLPGSTPHPRRGHVGPGGRAGTESAADPRPQVPISWREIACPACGRAHMRGQAMPGELRTCCGCGHTYPQPQPGHQPPRLPDPELDAALEPEAVE